MLPLLVCMQVLCLRRQLQLLHERRAQLSDAAAAAADALDSLRQQQHQALHDVEVQLRLKQGQVGRMRTDVSGRAYSGTQTVHMRQGHHEQHGRLHAVWNGRWCSCAPAPLS